MPNHVTSGQSRTKKYIFILISLGIGLFSILTTLEIFLRFMPVMSPMDFMEVNDNNTIFRFSPNRDYVFSNDWDFSIVNHVHINNYGFVNEQDYKRRSYDKLMVIIGDSYVEALMVPYRYTMHGRLAHILKDIGRVYSLGVSGAQLSQYLAFAQYAQHEFQPDAWVFVVVGNDFDESFIKYNKKPGLHYFTENSTKDLALMHLDYKRKYTSKLKNLLYYFSITRYIINNINIGHTIEYITKRKLKDLYVGNTSVDTTEERVIDSNRVVEAFFVQLSNISGVDKANVLFIVDGMRPDIYSQEEFHKAKGSYFDIMREYFMAVARREGYECIDMQDIFIVRHNLDGSYFEFPTDAHWNSLGHELAATAIATSDVFKRTFPGVDTQK